MGKRDRQQKLTGWIIGELEKEGLLRGKGNIEFGFGLTVIEYYGARREEHDGRNGKESLSES